MFQESQVKAHRQLARSPRSPRALIVDDEIDSIQPLQITLTNLGFEVVVAFDGNEALKYISRRDFDIVFLDISMPQLTGPQVLERFSGLKERILKPAWQRRRLPIITYSSYSAAEIRLPRMTDGFAVIDHWQKPMSVPEIAGQTGQLIDLLGIKFPHIDGKKGDA